MKVISIKYNSVCQFEECENRATHIAIGKTKYKTIGVYCEAHAYAVADEGNPEYTEICPNCGCFFGVS